MISKKEMIIPILNISPNFKLIWNQFLEDWQDEKDLPIYLLLTDLAIYLSKLEEKEEITKIFFVIEDWHLNGNSYVKEAATIGLLEDLQNLNIVGEGIPNKFESYLLPESKKWWDELYSFHKSLKLWNE